MSNANSPRNTGADKVATLDEAVAHVQPGDDIHIVTNHSRWSAAARHLVRAQWGQQPDFTLVMLSLSSLGSLFFKGGLVKKVVTGYSGDVFPNFTPNPWFSRAYLSGEVEVEHWSFLAYLQRLEAGAKGLPAMVTNSLAGSSMADNPGYTQVDTPFGRIGLVEAYRPDVAILHAPVADRQGNVMIGAPRLEGVWGALGAKRGAIVTVDRIVDDIRPWSHLVQIPGHRVLAVTETPLGAHPGGMFARDTPIDPYGEDLDFWSEARAVSHRGATDEGAAEFDEWIRHWVLEPATQDEYVARLGERKIAKLRRRAEFDSWKDDEAATPPDLDAPTNSWETAAVYGANYLAGRIHATEAHGVLAGAGVANLAAWLAVRVAQDQGSPCVLTAELGLWGYEPTPADPFVFNHRSFPTATMMGDADQILGTMVGGPGSTTLACLGAAQIDRAGNINSTVIPGKLFLVGSGGGNDVAAGADEVVVMSTLTNRRTVEACPYITSVGDNVVAFVTDLGLFEKVDGELVLTAVAPGSGTIDERVANISGLIGWDLRVADEVAELEPVDPAHVEVLRRWDPIGRFLRG